MLYNFVIEAEVDLKDMYMRIFGDDEKDVL